MHRNKWLLCGLCCAVLGTACDSSQRPAALTGAEVFNRSCSKCHSLIGDESRRKPGGDLVGYELTRDQVTSFTKVMPVRLTGAELRAVVTYVLAAQGGRPRRGLPGLKLRSG